MLRQFGGISPEVLRFYCKVMAELQLIIIKSTLDSEVMTKV